VPRGVDGGEDRPGVLEEALAGGQQAHASRGALEQGGAELVLEAADLPGQRRLREVQAPRGAADVLLLGDGDEVVELREAHAASVRGEDARGQGVDRKGIGRSMAKSLSERP
jgi:hypothetical protein